MGASLAIANYVVGAVKVAICKLEGGSYTLQQILQKPPPCTKVGFCEPFPGGTDDNNHFSFAGDRECGGQAGVLGGAGNGGLPFGGNPGSFVTFDIRLIPYKVIA